MPRKLVVGENYSREELLSLCEGHPDDRTWALDGKKALIVVHDLGNDFFKVIHLVARGPEANTQDKVLQQVPEHLRDAVRNILQCGDEHVATTVWCEEDVFEAATQAILAKMIRQSWLR